MAEEKKQDDSATATEGAQPGQQAGGQQVRLELDDSEAQALYANLCRVSSTPEEVVLDLALNPNPMANTSQTLKVTQRVILNHYTAKRLAALLTATIQRHEQQFGPIEVDVRKRLVSETT